MLVQSLLLAASASMVSAYPTSATAEMASISFMFPDGREPVAGQYHKQPCGTSPVGTITDFPLTGGKISTGQKAPTDNVNYLWSKFVDGDDYEFKTYGAATITDLSAGHYCSNAPDFASLGFKAGDKATLMIMYQNDGPPGKGFNKRWNFQCADVKLVDNWVEPSDFMCGNIGNETRVASTEQTMDVTISPTSMANQRAAANAAAAAASSGLSAPEAGGIGAGVAIGVVLLALGALWASGLVRFGRKNNVHLHDDRSSVSSVPVKQVSRN